MSASQAGRRGFEPHRPLHFFLPGFVQSSETSIFFLHWASICVRQPRNHRSVSLDEWARAHFFFLKYEFFTEPMQNGSQAAKPFFKGFVTQTQRHKGFCGRERSKTPREDPGIGGGDHHR
jgi:hypothetical protein